MTKNPEGTKFSKYLAGYLYRASEGTSADNISKDVLDCEDDAAYTNLGSSWRMPTKDEINTLFNQCGTGGAAICSATYVGKDADIPTAKGIYCCEDYDGVAGFLFIDGSGNKVFFPSAGSIGDCDFSNGTGNYWSRSLNSSSCEDVWLINVVQTTLGDNVNTNASLHKSLHPEWRFLPLSPSDVLYILPNRATGVAANE